GILVDLYALVLVLRFMLQAAHADYYNPVAQFVVQVTGPILRPL
ncbi:MAG: YggT family protein, partial [Gammaproteobacteria bacterium]|nr:YggT family protein [Gammaproteobacteria bacterium]